MSKSIQLYAGGTNGPDGYLGPFLPLVGGIVLGPSPPLGGLDLGPFSGLTGLGGLGLRPFSGLGYFQARVVQF